MADRRRPILGAAGFVPLIVGDVFGVADDCTEQNPCTGDTILWATWILSWFLGMVTAGIGVILASHPSGHQPPPRLTPANPSTRSRLRGRARAPGRKGSSRVTRGAARLVCTR